jgi:hypothetical protein
MHTIEYYATDFAGNVETIRSHLLQIDTVEPVTSHTLSGVAGNADWWQSDVAVELAALDATSGVSVTPYWLDRGGRQLYSGPFTISGEGSHLLEFRSRDVAGNDGFHHMVSVRIDTVAPGSTITRPSPGDWVSGTVTLSGTASDPVPGSGLETIVISRDGGAAWSAVVGTDRWSDPWDTTAGPDGEYDLGSQAVDIAGNHESPRFGTVYVDNTPPSTTITLDYTPGDNDWIRSPVDVSLTADDGRGIGVRHTEVRFDGEVWQTHVGPFTVSREGRSNIDYRSVDYLGNWEAVRSCPVRIDTVAPDTTAMPSGTAGNQGWWRSAVGLVLDASDTTSGVALTEFRIGGGTWKVYGDPLVIDGDGSHTIDYRSRDVAGNWESEDRLTVHIDTVDPDTSSQVYGAPGNAGWWRSAVQVALDASDATSGVDVTELDVDGNGWTAYVGAVLVSGQGEHIVRHRSTDVAGNVEEVATLSLHIDSVAPQTSVSLTGTLGDNGWYTTPVTLAIRATDPSPGSGVRGTTLDGQPATGPRYFGDGFHNLRYQSVDVAGNREITHSLDLKIDTVSPSAEIGNSAFCPDCGEVVVLRPLASDATSGVTSWQLQILDGPVVLEEWSGGGQPAPRSWGGSGIKPGTYDLMLQVRDQAGWRTSATGSVRVRRADSPPPPPPTSTPIAPSVTSTPLPSVTRRPDLPPTLTPIPRFQPTSTPRPEMTPSIFPSPPTSTPTPMALAEVSLPPDRGLALVVGVFEDYDTDATKALHEPGLAQWVVRVEGSGGWAQDFTADTRGLVTVTLPGPDIYVFTVVDPPGSWVPTSRPEMKIHLGEEGGVVILPASGGTMLPVGMAERTIFAFGLLPRRMAVFVPLAGLGLLLVVAGTGVLDPRPQALRKFREILVESNCDP